MPWTETRIMDARMKFVTEALEDIYSMAELCRAYDISRKTGYKWLGRYESQGPAGLSDRSKAPHNHPHAITKEVKQAVLSVKGRFNHWSPAKIRVRLEKEYPGWSCYPAVSTIGEHLRRQGFVCCRKRRHRASPTMLPLTVGNNSNDVWTADFKGYFRTGDGRRCNPLTISDDASRYLLCCRHLDRMSYELVRMQFERIFRDYGVPVVIRTDNGSPFSSRGLCGLSRLSYWWIRLGIHPERIMPGHPEHNGRHERMHKTLKRHTAAPPAKTIAAQQKRFDSFMVEYNDYRPHEALDMQTPASRYSSSVRCYPARLAEVYYPEHMKVYRVFDHGDVHYCGRRFFVSECLGGEYIGIEQIEQDRSRLWYCNYELGTVDHRKWQVTPAKCCALLAGASPSKQES
jgi:transposase InsO family protein